jgi:hypothetical protein
MKRLKPYVGLFQLVTLEPDRLAKKTITTPHRPPLSILQDGRFICSPNNEFASSLGVARIFDSLALGVDAPVDHMEVPLSPRQSGFNQVRYWRIPVKIEAILVAFHERIRRTTFASEEIAHTRSIFGILQLQKRHGLISIPALTEPRSWSPDDVEGPDDGNGAGSSGDGDQGLGKRKLVQSGSSREPRKRRGKAKAMGIEEG